MREWESALTNNYGWQPYNEYKYSLIPHAVDMTNQERLKFSMEMDYKTVTKIGDPAYGTRPKQMSLFKTAGKGFCVTAFRSKSKDTYELRLYETEGSITEAFIEMPSDIREVYETDLEGKRLRIIDNSERSFKTALKPWQIATFEIKVK
jgi:alpha-mannosidase